MSTAPARKLVQTFGRKKNAVAAATVREGKGTNKSKNQRSRKS